MKSVTTKLKGKKLQRNIIHPPQRCCSICVSYAAVLFRSPSYVRTNACRGNFLSWRGYSLTYLTKVIHEYRWQEHERSTNPKTMSQLQLYALLTTLRTSNIHQGIKTAFSCCYEGRYSCPSASTCLCGYMQTTNPVAVHKCLKFVYNFPDSWSSLDSLQ